MARFTVMGLMYANTCESVEADNAAAAAEKADLYATLCHQCAGEIDLGDVYAVRVIDSDGNLAYTDEADDNEPPPTLKDMIAAVRKAGYSVRKRPTRKEPARNG